MKTEKGKIDLNNNKNDISLVVAKSALGAIPFAGTALGEIVGSIIPNQRIDRVVLYLEKLQSLFSEADFELIKKVPNKLAIIEEGMFSAGLLPYRERVERIAYVIANGLSEEDFETDETSKILHAVKNISDYDVIILQSHALWGKELNGYEEAITFQKKYPQVWPDSINSFEQELDCKESQELNRLYNKAIEKVLLSQRHLSSLSLLKPYIPSIYSGYSNNTLKEATDNIQKLSSAFSDEEYSITDFGLKIINFIKNPNEELAV